MNLTTPQRNTLFAAFRAHPQPYQVRDARVPLRLCEMGLLLQVEGGKSPVRSFVLGAGRAVATSGQAGMAAAPAAAQRPRGQPETWPFLVSAHDWAPLATVLFAGSFLLAGY